MVVQTSLAPLTGGDLPKLRADAPVVAARVAAAAASKGFKVQVGAFSTAENAQKAVAELAQAGPATVTPMTTKAGTTLYRVVLAGADDAKTAEALRQKVVAAGFADAWVMRP
jgi:cell division protein FtsN